MRHIVAQLFAIAHELNEPIALETERLRISAWIGLEHGDFGNAVGDLSNDAFDGDSGKALND